FMDVAGLDVMKQWLDKRRDAFFGDDPRMRPRGVMLFGVQGSGKSLAAKAVAGSWGVPLLRLDMGNMYNKYIGETERNLREALEMAETMSPCVVWMDEIEKGLGQDGSDSGVSQRLLGTLLTWLAEHKSSVFTVMTANNIHALPPELVRKGRLDELFFVDLPRVDVREAIIRLHLAKRQIADDTIDVAAVAAASDGFSGAELEQVLVSACHRRGRSMQAAETRLVTTDDLIDEVQRTCPLSVTMAEAVQDLRDWAVGRAVLADSAH
ncbi:MAG: AAA family ATPase, partial [Thalassolituus oleivorans]|nr:AAA family ATPase [Thalassolituus oleivorans]